MVEIPGWYTNSTVYTDTVCTAYGIRCMDCTVLTDTIYWGDPHALLKTLWQHDICHLCVQQRPTIFLSSKYQIQRLANDSEKLLHSSCKPYRMAMASSIDPKKGTRILPLEKSHYKGCGSPVLADTNVTLT